MTQGRDEGGLDQGVAVEVVRLRIQFEDRAKSVSFVISSSLPEHLKSAMIYGSPQGILQR